MAAVMEGDFLEKTEEAEQAKEVNHQDISGYIWIYILLFIYPFVHPLTISAGGGDRLYSAVSDSDV